MVPGVVVFDYSTWRLRYPELAASVNDALAALYFAEATLYLNNTPTSLVCDLPQRAMCLNMLTAHIAALNSAASSPIVGRIASASEGSVSVSTENSYPPGTVQWYQQTKYGAAYWAATARFRTMRYIPSPARPTDPYAPFPYSNPFWRQ